MLALDLRFEKPRLSCLKRVLKELIRYGRGGGKNEVVGGKVGRW